MFYALSLEEWYHACLDNAADGAALQSSDCFYLLSFSAGQVHAIGSGYD